MDFYFGELLRAIARAQVKLAKIEHEYAEDADDVNIPSTEAFQRGVWPSVDDDDWCGEFQTKYP